VKTQDSKEVKFMPMLDSQVMPFGKYKGTRLSSVPADYLKWIWDTFDHAVTGNLAIIDYIRRNQDRLKEENEKNNSRGSDEG